MGVQAARWVALVLLVFAVAGCSPAPQSGGQLRTLPGDAVLSPDARFVAYTRKGNGDDPEGYHIFVSDADGSNARQITDAAGTNDADPSWSPDGKAIIFVRALRGCLNSPGGVIGDRGDVWSVYSDGSGEEQLTNEHFFQAGNPHFSPDGRRILFWAYHEAAPGSLAGTPGYLDVVTATLNDSGDFLRLRWMPATAGPGGDRFFLSQSRDPAFSADGSLIVFVSNRASGSASDYEVWTTDTSFNETIQITHMHTRLESPRFSDDAQTIEFTADPPGEGPKQRWRIGIDGTGLTQLGSR